MTFAPRAAGARIRSALERRATRLHAQRRLAADLATYRSPADLADLHAMIARGNERDTAEVRRILTQMRAS